MAERASRVMLLASEPPGSRDAKERKGPFKDSRLRTCISWQLGQRGSGTSQAPPAVQASPLNVADLGVRLSRWGLREHLTFKM